MANRKKSHNLGQPLPKQEAGGAPQSIVLQQIDIRPVQRREWDAPKWRSALQSAESRIPRRQSLYELYADVVLDPQVIATTSKIMDSVLGADWSFVDKDGKDVDEVKDIIKTKGWDVLIKAIVESRWWGYSMVEPKFHDNFDGKKLMSITDFPKLNLRPEQGIIAFDSMSDEGIDVRAGMYAKTILEVGDPKDLGLHLSAAPYQILKRGGVGDWAMFVQVFGEPIIDAVWDGLNDDQRAKLSTAIAARGAGGALIRPAGTEVNMLQPTGNANGDMQDKFMSYMDKAISKNYLGTTETTDSSKTSGYAQSQTHQEQDEVKEFNYITFVRKILNTDFRRILHYAGFPTKDGEFVVNGEDNELSKKESFEIHKSMKMEMKIPIDDDFMYEKYGVPKPDNYEKLKAEMQAEAMANEKLKMENENDPKAKGQKPKAKSQKPKADKEVTLIDYFRNLFSFAPRHERGTNTPLSGGAGGGLLRNPHHPE